MSAFHLPRDFVIALFGGLPHHLAVPHELVPVVRAAFVNAHDLTRFPDFLLEAFGRPPSLPFCRANHTDTGAFSASGLNGVPVGSGVGDVDWYALRSIRFSLTGRYAPYYDILYEGKIVDRNHTGNIPRAYNGEVLQAIGPETYQFRQQLYPATYIEAIRVEVSLKPRPRLSQAIAHTAASISNISSKRFIVPRPLRVPTFKHGRRQDGAGVLKDMSSMVM